MHLQTTTAIALPPPTAAVSDSDQARRLDRVSVSNLCPSRPHLSRSRHHVNRRPRNQAHFRTTIRRHFCYYTAIEVSVNSMLDYIANSRFAFPD